MERKLRGQLQMSRKFRIKALLGAPRGGWAAFPESGEETVAYGRTYDEAVAKAEESGVEEPVLVKIPDDWTPVV